MHFAVSNQKLKFFVIVQTLSDGDPTAMQITE